MVWLNPTPVSEEAMRNFELHFRFRINKNLRLFLMDHNGASCYPGSFPTEKTTRNLATLLDFSDETAPKGAWAVNKKLRNFLGPNRIIIGQDQKCNHVCIEKDRNRQKIVVWSHISNQFEECLLDIPGFIRIMN